MDYSELMQNDDLDYSELMQNHDLDQPSSLYEKLCTGERNVYDAIVYRSTIIRSTLDTVLDKCAKKVLKRQMDTFLRLVQLITDTNKTLNDVAFFLDLLCDIGLVKARSVFPVSICDHITYCEDFISSNLEICLNEISRLIYDLDLDEYVPYSSCNFTDILSEIRVIYKYYLNKFYEYDECLLKKFEED